MAEQITIASMEKTGRIFRLFFEDGSSMQWPDQDLMEDWIDNGGVKGSDRLIRGLLKRIRSSDPTFANISSISNVTYELPDVAEVP